MADVVDTYEGELTVKCVHAKSQASVLAESKIKDFGHHDSFSPVDLLSAALGSCALNTMGYYANRHGIDITGAEADVSCAMSGPTITSFELTFRMPSSGIDEKSKKALEGCVASCPVHKAIGADVEQKITFIWL